LHDTARLTGERFFQIYAADLTDGTVLDVGSMDVNGTLRPFVPDAMSYCGVDLAAGPNVTVVLDDPYRFPFGHEEFDVVTSTSCLEHDEFFWLTFVEMARVLKPGGFIYLNAPTGGAVHNHPIDCWRFYPDAGLALARWASRNGYEVNLVESFILPPGGEGWSDFVAVFQGGHERSRPKITLFDWFVREGDVFHPRP
jgi:SAM-dependent methyltransferase